MARIVTTAYRYKRPPQKKTPVALKVPAIITTKKSRRPRPRSAAAEAVSQSPRLHDEAAQPSTARSDVTTLRPARKPAIVTAKRGKGITVAAVDAGEASPSVKAFFARMVRPGGPLPPDRSE
jgi:hypothetical protein